MLLSLFYSVFQPETNKLESETSVNVSSKSVQKWFDEGIDLSKRGRNLNDVGKKFTGRFDSYGEFIVWTPRAISILAGFKSREESWDAGKRDKILGFLTDSSFRRPNSLYVSSMVFFPSSRQFSSIRLALEQGRIRFPTEDVKFEGIFENVVKFRDVVAFVPPVFEDACLGWNLESQNSLYEGRYTSARLFKLSRGLDSIDLYNWALVAGGSIRIRASGGSLLFSPNSEFTIILSVNGVSVSGKIRLPR